MKRKETRAWLIFLSIIISGCSDAPRRETPPTGVSSANHAHAVKAAVVRAIEDDRNAERIFDLKGSHSTQNIGEGAMLTFFSFQYAEARLVAGGRANFDSLRLIAEDANEPEKLRRKAAHIAGRLNARWHFYWLTKNEKGVGYEIATEFATTAPMVAFAKVERYSSPESIKELFGQAENPLAYDEFVTANLDIMFDASRVKGDGALEVPDGTLIRWLSLSTDESVSDELKKDDSEVAAFYESKLSEGYNPLSLFSDLISDREDEVRRAAKLIYKDPHERLMFVRLICRFYSESANRGDGPKGWRTRAQDWYRARRGQLKYSEQENRIVETGAEKRH